MKKKVVYKNIISLLLLQIITIICGFVIPKLIILNYGSTTNGLITSISKFLAYITLLEFGFGPVIKSLLYKPIANKNKNEIENILHASTIFFKKLSYIFIIYSVFISFIFPHIIHDFDSLYTVSLIIIIAISTFSEYYFGITYKLFLDAKQKTYVASTIQIITLIINTLVTILLIKLKCEIHIIKLISTIIYVIRALAYNIYVKKKYNIDINNATEDYKLEKKWDGFAQHLAYVVHNNIDVIILTLFSSLINVSIYYVYIIIINSIKSILQSITSGIEPTYGDMMAKEIDINNSFKRYESIYYTILTILFISTLVLIMPFISIYTKNITDANYIIPLFGYILVIAEFIWAIRLPYSGITIAKGHFKEIKLAAYIEIFLNISISLILVFKYNLIGVAIGTLIAMITRTIHFIYHSSKDILKRKVTYIFKYISIMIIEIVITLLILNIIPSATINSYISWILQALKVVLISSLIVIPINVLAYRKEVYYE